MKSAAFNVLAGKRQLFLDDKGVQRTSNVKQVMHQPVKKGAVIRPTPFVESYLQTRSTPCWNPERQLFQLWLTGEMDSTYAESRDGLHWTKPDLGQAERNILKLDPALEWPADALLHVVRDPREPNPSKRYKGLGHFYGRKSFASPDGIRWKTMNVKPLPSQDESNMSYDAEHGLFIATLKHGGPYGRSVYVSTSADFDTWTDQELIFHADERDQELAGIVIERRLADPHFRRPEAVTPEIFNADVYNMAVFWYESMYIGLPAIYFAAGKLPDYDLTTGFHHIQLACSRNLLQWTRLGDRRPFIEPSPLGAGAYDMTMILPPSAPVVQGNELWFYYTGIKYGDAALHGDNDGSAICFCFLRRDGFVSLDALEGEGWVSTKSFMLPEGELHVNADALGGNVSVQVCDPKGKTIDGYEQSKPVYGNQPDAVIHWQDRRLASLAGRPVSLRFKLDRARIYSYWIE